MLQTNTQLMGAPKYLNNRLERQSNHRLEGLAKEERCSLSDSSLPLQPEHSLDKDRGMDGESKARRTSQTIVLGTIPYAPTRQYPVTLLARQNPSSVVGADIFPYSVVGTIYSHMVRLPPTCLWASIVF